MHLPLSFAATAALLATNAATIAAAPQKGYRPIQDGPVDRRRQSDYPPLDYPPLADLGDRRRQSDYPPLDYPPLAEPEDRRRQSDYPPLDYPPLTEPDRRRQLGYRPLDDADSDQDRRRQSDYPPLDYPPLSGSDRRRQLGYRPLSTLTGKSNVDKYFETISASTHNFFEYIKIDLSSVAAPATNLASFQPTNKDRRIIGDDDRKAVTSQDFPYRSIGRVIWSNGDVCTGALVGDRLVLTAKHCLDLHKDEGPLFQPGFDEGDESFGTWRAASAYYLSDSEGACQVKDDWAVIVLTEPIGTYYGYFGVQLLDEEKLDKARLVHAGYPVDVSDGLKQYQQQGVSAWSGFEELKCDAEGPVFTDADVEAGQAGSPIWDSDVTNGPALFGVLVAEWESGDDKVTAVATGSDLVSAVEKLRKEFPL